MRHTLFCFGFGYCAQALSKRLVTMGWNVVGTSRNPEKAKQNKISATLYPLSNTVTLDDEAIAHLKTAEAVLISIPPHDKGDLVLKNYSTILAENKNLKWVAYLSTTGVYGDYKGDWVDETSLPKPLDTRSKNRLKAEQGWLNLFEDKNIPVHIFRLAGIYGPHRTPMARIRNGQGDIIVKKGQFFNRIHVDDITRILKKSLDYPTPGEIYNVTDDEPSSQADVMHFAYRLMGIDEPKEIHFENADLSPMARDFYMSNKRVRNSKVKEKLKIDLEYPSYRKGLTALKYPEGFI